MELLWTRKESVIWGLCSISFKTCPLHVHNIPRRPQRGQAELCHSESLELTNWGTDASKIPGPVGPLQENMYVGLDHEQDGS